MAIFPRLRFAFCGMTSYCTLKVPQAFIGPKKAHTSLSLFGAPGEKAPSRPNAPMQHNGASVHGFAFQTKVAIIQNK